MYANCKYVINWENRKWQRNLDIKGKQAFKGIVSGVDITTEPTHSQVSYDSDQMVTNPLFSTDDEQPYLVGLPNRKRKFSYPLSGATVNMQLTNTKHILLEKKED